MLKLAFLSSGFLIAPLFWSIPAQHDEVPVITLERTGCFGSCPAYMLQIYSDGRTKFSGSEWVLVRGNAEGRISLASVRSLLDEARAIGFFELDTEYRGCGKIVTDLPTITTTIRLDGNTKRVLDHFCAPESLHVFEAQIDRTAHSLRWIGLAGDRNLTNYIDFNAQFPGADSLRVVWGHADSLEKERGWTEQISQTHGRAVDEYEKRYAVAYKPFIDSMIVARTAYYRSLTDFQIDSIESIHWPFR